MYNNESPSAGLRTSNPIGTASGERTSGPAMGRYSVHSHGGARPWQPNRPGSWTTGSLPIEASDRPVVFWCARSAVDLAVGLGSLGSLCWRCGSNFLFLIEETRCISETFAAQSPG